jgi:large subunit ribosomal protein L15
MLDLSNLTPAKTGSRKRKRVGRGPSSGLGKTSGRGHKGQKSRSGFSHRFGFEGGQMPLIRRLPKRGFHHEKRHGFAEINLDVLNDNFEDGAEVTEAALQQRHLIKRQGGGIKVLGRGELTKKLSLKINAISDGARKKVGAAGGTIEILETPEAKAVVRRKKPGGKK